MKYAFIQRNKLVWPISVQCRVLLVSVSGYHEHLTRRLDISQRRHLSDEALLVHISAVYAENRGAYGWPRIWRQLRAQGIRVGKQRVQLTLATWLGPLRRFVRMRPGKSILSSSF